MKQEKTIAIYITDQHYQIKNRILELPSNCIPGYIVEVYKNKKLIDSMYCMRKESANDRAKEFDREYRLAEGWN